MEVITPTHNISFLPKAMSKRMFHTEQFRNTLKYFDKPQKKTIPKHCHENFPKKIFQKFQKITGFTSYVSQEYFWKWEKIFKIFSEKLFSFFPVSLTLKWKKE